MVSVRRGFSAGTEYSPTTEQHLRRSEEVLTLASRRNLARI